MDEQKLFAELTESAKRNDSINRRLTMIIIVAFICFAVTVSSMVGFYFFSDYSYPTAQQEVQIPEATVNQNIGGAAE